MQNSQAFAPRENSHPVPDLHFVDGRLRFKTPMVVREKLTADAESGIVARIAEKWSTTRITTFTAITSSQSAFEVQLSEGVILAFNFKDPITRTIDRNRRQLAIQLLIKRPHSGDNALNLAHTFIRFVEANAGSVQRVFFKFGAIDAKLLGRNPIETVSKQRLLPIYQRRFGCEPIGKTEYFAVRFEPQDNRPEENAVVSAIAPVPYPTAAVAASTLAGSAI